MVSKGDCQQRAVGYFPDVKKSFASSYGALYVTSTFTN